MNYLYTVLAVTKVVDGDTVDVLLDLGFNIRHKVRVRLADINAPEPRGETREKGIAARERLRELMSEGMRQGDLSVFTKKTGKYGRWLGHFYTTNKNINMRMVTEGFAKEQGF